MKRRPWEVWSSPAEEVRVQSEAFRLLRTSLGIAMVDLRVPALMITSCAPDEGKTTVCARLALSFAAAGSRVVVVDLDLRHPALHSRFGAHNEFGVSDVVLDRRSITKALQFVEVPSTSGVPGVYVLAAGPPIADSTELLGGHRTRRLIESVGQQADLVLVDAPPVLPVADALVIGRVVGGALLVVESRRTTYQQIQRAEEALGRNGIPLLGAVLNKQRSSDSSGEIAYGYGPPAGVQG